MNEPLDHEDDQVTPALIELARAEQQLREQEPLAYNLLPTDQILRGYQEQLEELVGKS